MKRTVIFTLDNGSRVKAKINRRGSVSYSPDLDGSVRSWDIKDIASHTLFYVNPSRIVALEVLKRWWLR